MKRRENPLDYIQAFKVTLATREQRSRAVCRWTLLLCNRAHIFYYFNTKIINLALFDVIKISYKTILQIYISNWLQWFLHSLHVLQCRFSKSKWESPICASPPLILGPGGYVGLIVAPFSLPYLFVFTQCRGQGSSQVTSGRSNSHRPPLSISN